MALLWFGKATRLGDFKTTDLEKEKLIQQVQYDQLLSRQRRAADETQSLLEAASEPGITESEKDLAAYKMSRAEKRRLKAESDMQQVISRMDVLDSTLDLLHRKDDLKHNRIWDKINNMDPDKLQDQLEVLAIERKKGDVNLDKITEVLDVERFDVAAKRSADFRRAKDLIDGRATEKAGG